jgi:hypothetical protein
MDELTPAVENAKGGEDYVPEGYESLDAFLTETRKRHQKGVDGDRLNRDEGMDDLLFLSGEGQWDDTVRASRKEKGRPCLTINTLPQYVGQVIGDIRANRPSIKVRPAEDGDKKIAEIRQGLIRFIENKSRAQMVYSLAGEDQVSCGIGNFRIGLEWSEGDTFDRDIIIKHIPNPFAVVWDPMSTEPTGADAGWCFVDDEMDRESFKERFGEDALPTTLTVPLSQHGWVTNDTVRVTEYWVMKERKRTIALLQRAPEAQPQIIDITDDLEQAQQFIVKAPNGAPYSREVTKKSACMYLTNGHKILDGPYEYPISRLPIFRVMGREIRLATRRYRFGLIRFAKDPIRMKNLWRSSAAEWIGLAPKAQWLIHSSNEESEDIFRAAATSADPVLPWTGSQKPERIEPPSSPSALLQEAQMNDQDIKDVTGLHDASLGMKSNETSGKAIMARERQGDVATFMYHDNLNSAVQACGIVANELIPITFDTARTLVVLGEDDSSQTVRVNDPTDPEAVDLKVGKYDIVVETGPSYSTKRVEAAESMMAFVQAVPGAAAVAADLIAEAQDWPKADAIAKRLKRAIPANLTEGEDGEEDQDPNSPQAQMKAQAQQAQQEQMGMAREQAQMGLREQKAKTRQAEANASKAEFEAQEAEIRLFLSKSQPMPMAPQPGL